MTKQLFKDGDKVRSSHFAGIGIVRLCKSDVITEYPVAVTTNRNTTLTYTRDGKYNRFSSKPTLWIVDPDESEWIPEKPTWCWVWNHCHEPGTTKKCVRLIYRYTGGFYEVLPPVPSGFIPNWECAEPCEDKDIPDYWPEGWR